MTPSWLRLKRLLLSAYFVLWIPGLLLLLRRSHQAEILGWWSRRAFLLAVLDVGALAVVTGLLYGVLKKNSPWPGRLERCLRFLRSRRMILTPLALAPPSGLLAIVLYMGRISVPLTIQVLLCLAASAALVVILELSLLCGGRSEAEQRELLKKCLLAAVSLVVSLLLVEALGQVFRWHRFALWDINPKNLDVRFHTDDFDVRVTTNSQGLRERRDLALTDPAAYRVVVVGDSMTFGWGAEEEETYPRVAERVLREKYQWDRVQVINLGRAGANLREYLTYVRRYAVQFRPQVIVIGFLVGNDCPIDSPPRLRDEAEFQATLREYIAASQPSVADRLIGSSCVVRSLYAGVYRRLGMLPPLASSGKPNPIYGEPNPLARQALAEAIHASPDPEKSRDMLSHLERQGWIEKGLRWGVNPWLIRSIILQPEGPADSLVARPATAGTMRQEWQLCEGVLSEIHRVAKETDAELVILAIPAAYAASPRWVRFLRSLGCEASDELTKLRTINDWLAEFASRENVACLDTLDEIRAAVAAGEQIYFDTDGHLTPLGYRLVGQLLAAGLADRIAAPGRASAR